MTVVPAPAASRAAVDIRRRQRFSASDDGFRWLSIAAGLSVLVVLALILLSTSVESWPVLRQEGLGFLFSNDWVPNEERFGALPLVFGTLVSSAIALLIAVPVSIGMGLFLTEVAPARLRAAVTTLVDLLAAIPSVVYGLWGILVLAPWLDGVYSSVEGATEGIPVVGTLLSGSAGGRGIFTAGLVLSLMVTPVVTSVSREVLATVAPGQKEAAYGLGATRWEMIRTSMLPVSLGGLTAASMLGLGRALGETIAAALVIGSSAQITAQLFAPGDSMAAVVANQFGEASGTFRSALIGLGFLLFVITVVVNTLARTIVLGPDPIGGPRMSRTDPLLVATGARASVTRGRRLRDRSATVLVWASVVAAAVPLALVLGYVIFKGAGVISWDFLTGDIGPVRREGGGMGPAIVGTLLITGAAACMAIPIGILAAISLVEFERSNPVSGLVRFLSDVMAGVPSIVMGLFVYTAWVLRFREQNAFAGALALACLMLPIVVRSTETMLRLVPQDLRDGARALGSNPSVVVLRVVLPAALPGIVSGCLLAIARAAGETAPLLFTIGVIYTANLNLFEGTNTALSTQIFGNAQQPFPAAQGRAWGAALTLIVLVMVLTALARLFIRRFASR